MIKKWSCIRAIAAAHALIAVTTSASAADRSCRADIAKYCKEIQPGTGRIVACLGEHDPDLSTDCKAALKPAR